METGQVENADSSCFLKCITIKRLLKWNVVYIIVSLLNIIELQLIGEDFMDTAVSYFFGSLPQYTLWPQKLYYVIKISLMIIVSFKMRNIKSLEALGVKIIKTLLVILLLNELAFILIIMKFKTIDQGEALEVSVAYVSIFLIDYSFLITILLGFIIYTKKHDSHLSTHSN